MVDAGTWRIATEIATFSIGTSRVSTLLKKYGFPVERYHVTRDSARPRLIEIVRLYQAGMSMAEVGERFGISESRVSQIVRGAGVQARRAGGGKLQRAAMRSPGLSAESGGK